MFYFLCKTVLHGRMHSVTTLRNYPPLMLSLRCISASSDQKSFTVSYLIETCGFSKESALTAAKHVYFRTPENPDSVIAFFKKQGFSKTQITTVIKKRPQVLICKVEKTLLPKIEFFRFKGVSSSDLVRIFTAYSTILVTSLEKQIIPAFNFISNLLESDEDTVYAIKRLPRLISYDVESYVLPNINVLRNIGVPQSYIILMFRMQPQTLLRSPVKFMESVETVKKMGFNPMNKSYLAALFVYTSMSKSTWEKKFDTYRMWGWSEEEIFKAFRNQPNCMVTSKEKIMTMMHFLVNKMSFKSSAIAKHPRILMSSLEKKILPRGLFAQDLLLSKGFVKNFNLRSLFLSSEKVFLNKFINCYGAEAPKLLKLYQEKLDLSSKWKSDMKASTFVKSGH
ncbi:hypothetical protein QUC31_016256 [Theobroma cacao]|uniref:Mitochondrial transcription termination factor family protein, putative n=1 Tax=Theobroma cacao TaxID=3641 RepID=A0A061EP78_THECC|nr:Mitochondrial transcription termination factor family protein, putative [Theobroma cacao]